MVLSQTPVTHRRRRAPAYPYMDWVFTSETQFRKALAKVADRIKSAIPSKEDQHAFADRIFDALYAPRVPQDIQCSTEQAPIVEKLSVCNTVERLPGPVGDLFEPAGDELSAAQLAAVHADITHFRCSWPQLHACGHAGDACMRPCSWLQRRCVIAAVCPG